MMEKRLSPERVWHEHEKAVDFNSGIDLYDTIKVNENFFIGKQWEGVKSNGLPTPVFNFLKRVTMFSVASVSADNIKLNASPIKSASDKRAEELEIITDIVNDQFTKIFEDNKIPSKIREYSRNAAVDGDGTTFTWWDDKAGSVKTEVIMNTQLEVSNPNSRDIQSQYYIIVNRRVPLREAQKIAKNNGESEEEIAKIVPDLKDANGDMDSLGGEKVTVLLRMWKDDDGNVWAYQCTKSAEMRKEWNTGLSLYPVTWFPWDFIQDCYHGQALISGLIPNQIFINRMFAMTELSLMTTAFPKVLFDKTRIRNWDNRVGAAIGMTGGDVSTAARIMDPAQVSPQISQFIELAVNYTQKFLGASDAALGDTRPDNTSAIIALQRASSVPMELTKRAMLQSVEDLGRIYVDFMGTYYGRQYVETTDRTTGITDTVKYDFSELKKIPLAINIDAGASSYWSEIANQQTLDNLLMNNKITTKQYIERLPSGVITDKEALLKSLEEPVNPMPQGTGISMDNTAEIPTGRGNADLQRTINQTGEIPAAPKEV
jgi:hypothetical protein